jgi:hypothetical protein
MAAGASVADLATWIIFSWERGVVLVIVVAEAGVMATQGVRYFVSALPVTLACIGVTGAAPWPRDHAERIVALAGRPGPP